MSVNRTTSAGSVCMALAAACIGLLSDTASAQARSNEAFAVVANGRSVGHLDALVDGSKVTVNYSVSDNGRGPSSNEVMQLGGDGLPSRWEVTGKSLVGAPLHEVMERRAGRLRWSGEADSGSVSIKGPVVYLLNDASPWALGAYARAALQSPVGEVEVVPRGTLHAQDVGAVSLSRGDEVLTGRAIRLSGLWMEPRYVVLDTRRALVAALGDDGTLIRAGYEANVSHLEDFVNSLAIARLRELQTHLAHRYDVPVEIENVHVFDARTGKIGPLAAVEVFRDRISRLSSDPISHMPSGTRVMIDGQGGVLIPGLRDMHSHTTLESGLFNLAAGVTSTRDMGNEAKFLLDLIPRFDVGELPGTRVTPNGFIEGVSPYSASIGVLAPSLQTALDEIGWYADHGYFQLKIYSSIDPEWVGPMAARAHELGMGVTGHIPAFMNADQAIRAGYDEIAHINQLMYGWVLGPGEDTRTRLRITAQHRFADVDLASPRVLATLNLMRERRTVLDDTVAIQERLALARAGRGQRGDQPFLDHVPIAYQRHLKRNFVAIDSDALDHRYSAAVDRMLQLIRLLHAQGNPLMPGTDDPYGFPIHRELELYVQAGIPAADALRIDTFETARYLNQDQSLGTIERGKLADLVLLSGDPTQDISQLRKPRMVLRGGVVYFPDEIYRALSIEPFSTAPPMRVPAG